MAVTLASYIPNLCRAEIGVKEIPLNSNRGPRVNEYKGATNLNPKEAWPWCAAFVCWIVRAAMAKGKKDGERYTFKRPTTAGAWDLENWSLAQDDSTWTKRKPGADIKAGDIVIYTFSHVGIAIRDAKDGIVVTVEGNTNKAGAREGGGVFRKVRKLSEIKTRIRFRV